MYSAEGGCAMGMSVPSRSLVVRGQSMHTMAAVSSVVPSGGDRHSSLLK